MSPDAQVRRFLSELLEQVQSGRVRVTAYRLRHTSAGFEARIAYAPVVSHRPCRCAAAPLPTREGYICPDCGAQWKEGSDADPDAADQGGAA